MPPGVGYGQDFVPVPGTDLMLPPELAQQVNPQPFGFAALQPEVPQEQVSPPEGAVPGLPEADTVPPWMRDQGIQKAKVSTQGYAPEVTRPRDPMTPLVQADQRVVDASEQSAQTVEQLGQVAGQYQEEVLGPAAAERKRIIDENEVDRQEVAAQFEADRAEQEGRIQANIDAIKQQDPKRWWKNMNGFQQAASIISAGIDGFLNPTGPNGAVELALKLAQQDAEAQAEDNANARAKVGYAQNAYERLLGNHQLKLHDIAENKIYRLESLAADVEQRGMSFKSQITQLEHAKQANAIRMEAEKERAGLAQSQATVLNAAAERSLRERMQKREFAFEQWKAKQTKNATAGSNLLPDPATGRNWVIGKETADKEGRVKNWADSKNGISVYASLLTGANGEGGLKQYAAKVSALGRTYAGPGAGTAAVVSQQQQLRSELSALREQLVAKYRHGLYGAALTDQEAKKFETMLPSPEGITGPTSTEALTTFIKTKASEAQTSFINPMGIKDEATGKDVDLVKEWGTIDLKDENIAYKDASALVESGNQAAAGMMELPRTPEAAKAGRQQAQLLEARAREIVSRAKNYASRSNMSPEVGAAALNTLKEWTALTEDVAPDVSDRLMQLSVEFEKQITSVPVKDPAGYDVQIGQRR